MPIYFVFTISFYFMYSINLSGYLAASVQIKPVELAGNYVEIKNPYRHTPGTKANSQHITVSNNTSQSNSGNIATADY